jgi:hypothetical protein
MTRCHVLLPGEVGTTPAYLMGFAQDNGPEMTMDYVAVIRRHPGDCYLCLLHPSRVTLDEEPSNDWERALLKTLEPYGTKVRKYGR